MIKISIYQNNKKILGGVSNIEEDKVKEIIDSERPITTFTNITQLGLSAGCSVEDIFLALPNNSYFECGTASGVDGYSTITNLPTTSTSTLLTIRKYTQARFNIEVKISSSGDVEPNEMYIGQLKGSDGTGLTWSRVISTTVADVAWTSLAVNSWAAGSVRYRVKNGICYVQVSGLHSPTMSTKEQTITSGLPVPEISSWYTLISNSTTEGGLFVRIDSTGEMVNYIGLDNMPYYGFFSYPVAES